MDDELQKFEYLWDGSHPEWILHRLTYEKDPKLENFVIVNKLNQHALVIEDDKIADDVISRMQNSGVEMITNVVPK